MRWLFALCPAIALAGCGTFNAQQAGCVAGATLDATGQSVKLNPAQTQALQAGEAVSLIYCDGGASAPVATAK